MNVNSLIIKDYRKKDDFAVQKNEPNSKPISERPKMNVNLYVIKEYENETAFRLEQNKANSNPIKPNKMPKQTQNEPNQTQSQDPTPKRVGRIKEWPDEAQLLYNRC
ncbi:hypothetical protein ES703_59774 [subsurface metagenome]